MTKFIYTYLEHIYIDNVPGGLESIDLFDFEGDAMDLYRQQKAKYKDQYPELDVTTQDAAIAPQGDIDDDLVVNAGFSEVQDGQRKVRITLTVRKLPVR